MVATLTVKVNEIKNGKMVYMGVWCSSHLEEIKPLVKNFWIIVGRIEVIQLIVWNTNHKNCTFADLKMTVSIFFKIILTKQNNSKFRCCCPRLTVYIYVILNGLKIVCYFCSENLIYQNLCWLIICLELVHLPNDVYVVKPALPIDFCL